jgi:hypothetical protein
MKEKIRANSKLNTPNAELSTPNSQLISAVPARAEAHTVVSQHGRLSPFEHGSSSFAHVSRPNVFGNAREGRASCRCIELGARRGSAPSPQRARARCRSSFALHQAGWACAKMAIRIGRARRVGFG